MTCVRIRQGLWDALDAGTPLPSEAVRHVGTCPACRGYESAAKALHAALPEATGKETFPSVADAVTARIRRSRGAATPPVFVMPAGALGAAAFWYALWALLGTDGLLSWLPSYELPSLSAWLEAVPSAASLPPAGPLAGLTGLALMLWISTHRTLTKQAAGRDHG